MKRTNLVLRFLAGIIFIVCCGCVGIFARKGNIAVEVMTSFLGIIAFIIFYINNDTKSKT